ncbi:MAG: acyl carrier protein [Planctomycetota bacterium]
MRNELNEILSQVLRVASEMIEPDSSPDTIGSWDSLTHLELVNALEQRYDLRFNMREIQSMDSPRKIEAILEARNIPQT